jgi:ribonuclease BN (tRNA processing enzyme)
MMVILLGSGGWVPSATRETCCALVRKDGDALLLDAGSGLRRLITSPELLDGLSRLDIVLTHFHLDHTIGLSYLPRMNPALEVAVWAGGEALYRTRTGTVLRKLLDPPLFATDLTAMITSVHELRPGVETAIGTFTVCSRRQDLHSHPTLALRIDDVIVCCTDTAFDPGNAAFAAGAELLLHEAWYASATTLDSTHTAAGEAGRLAREADVGRLVLIHVHPQLPSDDELTRIARASFPDADIGEDLLALDVGREAADRRTHP